MCFHLPLRKNTNLELNKQMERSITFNLFFFREKDTSRHDILNYIKTLKHRKKDHLG